MKVIKPQFEDRERWEGFIKEQSSERVFGQAWDWGVFQVNAGHKAWRRLIINDEGKVVATALGIKLKLFSNFYTLYLAGGPVVKKGFETEAIKLLLDDIKGWAGKEKVINVRFDWPTDLDEELSSKLKTLGLKARKQVSPRESLLINLNESQEKLFADLHQKTRYNIRLAEKNNVQIIEAQNPSEFESFYKLMDATQKRQAFGIHSKNYYTALLNSLRTNPQAKLFLAKHSGNVVAGAAVLFYNDTATYLHGGSDHEYRHLMAPHLLHWVAIQKAKEAGLKCYDFWGITTSEDPKHPWAGISRFKKGFGGYTKKYAPTLELGISGWHTLYNTIRKFR